MHTPTEQNPSPNPEASPARRLRQEWIVIAVELLFCAALVLVDGIPPARAGRSVRSGGLPRADERRAVLGRGVLLAALLLGLAAELDLLGRVVAAPLARIVHGRRATPRQSACVRFAAQTAFAALVVIGPLVAPTVFPSFHGWELAVFLVALALPIGCSIADCQMRGF